MESPLASLLHFFSLIGSNMSVFFPMTCAVWKQMSPVLLCSIFSCLFPFRWFQTELLLVSPLVWCFSCRDIRLTLSSVLAQLCQRTASLRRQPSPTPWDSTGRPKGTTAPGTWCVEQRLRSGFQMVQPSSGLRPGLLLLTRIRLKPLWKKSTLPVLQPDC